MTSRKPIIKNKRDYKIWTHIQYLGINGPVVNMKECLHVIRKESANPENPVFVNTIHGVFPFLCVLASSARSCCSV